MNKYDRILRENVEQVILPLSEKILGLKAQKLEDISMDLHVTLEREADLIKKARDARNWPFILHIEFQVKDEPEMILRMQLYKALLQSKHKLPVRQFVLYLGEGKARMKYKLHELIEGEESNYQFKLKNIHDYDHKKLIRSKIPEEIILAILGDFKGEAPEKVIARILERLQKIAGNEAKLQKYVRQLAVLSRLRNLESQTTKLVEKMPITYDIEQDSLYQEGIKEGVNKKERDVIIKMLRDGLPLEQIVKYSGASMAHVQEIQKELSKS